MLPIYTDVYRTPIYIYIYIYIIYIYIYIYLCNHNYVLVADELFIPAAKHHAEYII